MTVTPPETTWTVTFEDEVRLASFFRIALLGTGVTRVEPCAPIVRDVVAMTRDDSFSLVATAWLTRMLIVVLAPTLPVTIAAPLPAENREAARVRVSGRLVSALTLAWSAVLSVVRAATCAVSAVFSPVSVVTCLERVFSPVSVVICAFSGSVAAVTSVGDLGADRIRREVGRDVGAAERRAGRAELGHRRQGRQVDAADGSAREAGRDRLDDVDPAADAGVAALAGWLSPRPWNAAGVFCHGM